MSTVMEKAKVQLLLKQPFFGSIVCKRKFVQDESIKTACVTKDGTIKYAPSFVEKLSVDECVFILAHEAMHVVYAHLPRLGNRDPMVWNIACDATINDLLKECGVGEMVEGVVDMPGARNETADAIYKRLMQNAKSHGGNSGNDPGNEQGQGLSPTMPQLDPDFQDLPPEEAKQCSESDAKEQEQQGLQEIASAAHICKQQGKMHGALAEVIEGLLTSKVPWQQVLERFMTSRSERHLSWSRPNKRFSAVYMPRRDRLPSMGKVVIGIDTSASIGDEEMKSFFGHIQAIMDQCNPEEIIVLYTTDQVECVERYSREDYPLVPKHNRWCGGTDMRAIPWWIDREGEEVECAVILTDGYTPFPDDSPCNLVWVITEGGAECEGVLGDVIHM